VYILKKMNMRFSEW